MLSKMLGVRIFDLEACGACNLACAFCPRELLPPSGTMSLETFEKFLEHVELCATDSLAFVGIGEPLLNRRLPEFLRLAKARCGAVRTWITSNGTLLDDRTLPPLLDAGLDTLDISFNGRDPGSYERLMKGARFEAVLANLDYAVRTLAGRRSATRLQINFIVAKENAWEEERIKEFWRARGIGHFRVQRLHDRNGDAPVAGWTPLDTPGLRCATCVLFEVTTFITWDGKVMYCCHDIPRRHPIADIRLHDWEEIRRRKAAIRRAGAWPAMCESCTDPLRHELRAELDGLILGEFRARLGAGTRRAVQGMRRMAGAGS